MGLKAYLVCQVMRERWSVDAFHGWSETFLGGVSKRSCRTQVHEHVFTLANKRMYCRLLFCFFLVDEGHSNWSQWYSARVTEQHEHFELRGSWPRADGQRDALVPSFGGGGNSTWTKYTSGKWPVWKMRTRPLLSQIIYKPLIKCIDIFFFFCKRGIKTKRVERDAVNLRIWHKIEEHFI